MYICYYQITMQFFNQYNFCTQYTFYILVIFHIRNTRSRRAGPSGQYFLSGANKNARMITLQISGLTDSSSRFQCEQKLLGTPGVVSFTFDLAKKRCMLRISQNLNVEVTYN